MIYEAANGNVSLQFDTVFPDASWKWQDKSNYLYSAALPGAIGSPFTSNTMPGTILNNTFFPPWGLSTVFFNPGNSSDYGNISSTVYFNQTFGPVLSEAFASVPGNPDDGVISGAGEPSPPIVKRTAIEKSDILTVHTYSAQLPTPAFGIWVNGTRMEYFSVREINYDNWPTASPSSPFPYPRLASTLPVNSTAIYIYHQINATIFAEEVWDEAVGSWRSSNVSISVTSAIQ